jgi:AcrR family transcriptional regulator
MAAKTSVKPDAAKREAILRAAVEVFAGEGFRGTDVQVIAERAGVGKGTVYRYFGDKQDLFWAAVYWVLDQLDRCLTEATAPFDRPTEKLLATCRAYGQFFERHPDYLEIFVSDRAEFRGKAPELHVQRHEKMVEQFAAIFRDGVAFGELRPLDARKVVIALGSTLHGAVVFSGYANVGASLAEVAAFAGEIFVRGIAAEAKLGGAEQ